MIRKITLLVLLLGCCKLVCAQDHPVFNQFYFNPYVYNPSYVGHNGLFEINASYRRQWADVQNAPQTMAFNLQYATQGNFRLGMALYSEQSVGLLANTGYLTGGYRIPLGTDHSLSFGLSVGVIQNSLDQQALGNFPQLLEDPEILNALDNTFYFSSQFGLNYQIKRLSLGIAFPKFFDNKVNSTEQFNSPAFDQLQQFIGNLSYKFPIGSDFSVQPIAMVRFIDKNNYQAEATGIVSYKDAIWVGGGYRYESGPIGHVGFNLINGLALSYSYEVAGINSTSFGGGSHEVHLKFRIKRRKDDAVIATEPVEEPPMVTEPEPEPAEEEPKTDPTPTSVEEEVTTVETEPIYTEPEPEPVEEEPVYIAPEPEPQPEPTVEQAAPVREEISVETGMQKGYYVVVGAFSSEQNAKRHASEVSNEGYEAVVSYNKNRGLYYVHLHRSDDMDRARKMQSLIRDIPLFSFKDAWVLRIK